MSLDKFVTVSTQHGPVKGDRRTTFLGVDYVNFQGIRFMKAPVGHLRFRAPVEPEKWTEAFDATQDCPSFPNFDQLAGAIAGIEDAGCVNVFTKNLKPNKLTPVLVYIHGGGFQMGSSSPNGYFGVNYLLQKDVVFVSFNYRVGALGFLSLDDPQLDVPGNAGLKDQRMALKWIKENIQNFGGDPNNITLFGTSAGGASVHYHLISKKSEGLFHRAIPMSGTSLNWSWALHPRRNYAEKMARACGYDGESDEKSVLEFLEAADFKAVVNASEDLLNDEEKYEEHLIFGIGPVIEPYVTDHVFLDKDPILMARDAWSKDIDVIFGATSNEGLLMRFIPDQENKRVQKMEDSTFFTPLLDLKLTSSDPKAKKFGKMLKELYYGATTPSADNILPFYYFHSDFQFWHGIQRSVLSRINGGGKGKTFTYYFDILTELNAFRKLLKCEEFPGVEHGGCCNYIFSSFLTPIPKIDSIEFKNVIKMLDFLANFAIHGVTGVAEWEENKSLELPLKVMHLHKDGMELIDLPETERLKVWDAIYAETGVDLY